MIKLPPSATVIWLQQAAAAKPAVGEPCNGCGVCCATEPCPVAMVFLMQRKGSCRALEWDHTGRLYRCGMLQRPAHYLRWLPTRWQSWFARRVARWIAAGTACDADSDVTLAVSTTSTSADR
jgi:hypothetical protein